MESISNVGMVLSSFGEIFPSNRKTKSLTESFFEENFHREPEGLRLYLPWVVLLTRSVTLICLHTKVTMYLLGLFSCFHAIKRQRLCIRK